MIRRLVYVGVVMAAVTGPSFGDVASPAEVLAATYGSDAKISEAQAQDMVVALQQALARCTDPSLSARIKYRTGVIYFKAGMMTNAAKVFQETAEEDHSPSLVRLCCLNMIGQIGRLTGADAKALAAFAELIDGGERWLATPADMSVRPMITRLLCLARLARAEIYDTRGDYLQSILEYDRLIDFLGRCADTALVNRYGPVAYERLAQSHLRAGRLESYFTAAKALVEGQPDYYRTPVVKLEMECVTFLKKVDPNHSFPRGSMDAPAHAILVLKDANEPDCPLIRTVSTLCHQYQRGYAGMLLHYHYAWMLDATGNSSEALVVLARIATMDVERRDGGSASDVLAQIIRDYAKIQSAMLLAERADYRQALDIVKDLGPGPHLSHVSELSDAVSNSIDTLRRETPKHE